MYTWVTDGSKFIFRESQQLQDNYKATMNHGMPLTVFYSSTNEVIVQLSPGLIQIPSFWDINVKDNDL